MKKRSLFAAVAMLIVSAVVLTSATYAWFAASSTATVTGFSATVSNDDGSLLVSGDSGANWGYTIDVSSISNANKAIASALTPVSVTPSTGKVVGGGFDTDGETWKSKAAAAGTDYTTVQFQIKSTVDVNTVTGSVTGLTVQKDYLRAAVYVDGTLKAVYGSANAADYYPIAWTAAYEATPANTLTGKDDAPKNFIMDSTNDASYPTLASQFTDTTNNGTFTFSLTEETPVTVKVLIWAEGNDENCVGSASNSAISFGLSFTK